jgi:hypothetical protein
MRKLVGKWEQERGDLSARLRTLLCQHAAMEPAADDPCLAALAPVLAAAPNDAHIGVIALQGSLCPMHRGHLNLLTTARAFVLGESASTLPGWDSPRCDRVVALVGANPDRHVSNKMAQRNVASLSYSDRVQLAALTLATADNLPFALISQEGRRLSEAFDALNRAYPRLRFTMFKVSGTDDALSGKKWRENVPSTVRLVLPRSPDPSDPDTVQLLTSLASECPPGTPVSVASFPGFLLGPHQSFSCSSTMARAALAAGDLAEIDHCLVPEVAMWLSEHGPYQPTAADGTCDTASPPRK